RRARDRDRRPDRRRPRARRDPLRHPDQAGRERGRARHRHRRRGLAARLVAPADHRRPRRGPAGSGRARRGHRAPAGGQGTGIGEGSMNPYVLDLRERDVGGPVTSGHLYMATDGGQIDADGPALPAFTALTRGCEVVALVHGYNTSRPVGWDALVRFARFLEAGGVTAIVMAVLWPGDGWAKAL